MSTEFDAKTKGLMQAFMQVFELNRMPHPSDQRARLTFPEAQAIRDQYLAGGITQQALADQWGITQSLVSAICRHKNWKLGTAPKTRIRRAK